MIRLTLGGCGDTARYERSVRPLRDVALVAEDDSPDAVVVASTTRAVQAARAGKHVLLELSPEATAEELNAVAAACREASVRCMVGQTRRFLARAQTIKGSLDDGKLGTLGLVRIHRWESEKPVGLWAEIDLAQWLFGALPNAVYARAASANDGYVQVHLGFPDGGMALIDTTSALPSGPGYYSLSAIGSSGAAYGDDHHNAHLVYGGGKPRALMAREEDASVTSQLQEFVAAVTADREPAMTSVHACAALEVADAVHRSIASGCCLRRTGGAYDVS